MNPDSDSDDYDEGDESQTQNVWRPAKRVKGSHGANDDDDQDVSPSNPNKKRAPRRFKITERVNHESDDDDRSQVIRGKWTLKRKTDETEANNKPSVFDLL